MNFMKHAAFFKYVQDYIQDNPEAAAHISDYVAAGIEASRQQALERAADMEVALSAAIAKRFNKREDLILSKLERWNGHSALRWDDTIEMLKGSKK